MSQALIFDFDGLILDTESAIYEVWRNFYAQHGHALSIQTWSQCIGSDFSHSYDPKTQLEALTRQRFDWPAVDARLTQEALALLEHYPVLPGVKELLLAAKTAAIPCAMASSSPRDWVVPHLERIQLKPFFAHVITKEAVERVKPAPDLFLKAAKELGIDPKQAIVLEDSLNGLRAATAAGMRCVIAAGPTTQHLDFSAAWRRVGSLAEITLASLL
jgi:HAD superfamily hydrolase (TIGR01509 family)